MSRDTLLEFPCSFPIKAIGPQGEDFEDLVHELVKQHVPELTRHDLSCNASSSGKYLSVTAHIEAQSQAQLDAIYSDLTASEQVMMAL